MLQISRSNSPTLIATLTQSLAANSLSTRNTPIVITFLSDRILFPQSSQTSNYGFVIDVVPIVDGGWSDWGPFGSCDGSCDDGLTGLKLRRRSCTNPPPSNGGLNCNGEPIELISCPLNCTINDALKSTINSSVISTTTLAGATSEAHEAKSLLTSQMIIIIAGAGGGVLILTIVTTAVVWNIKSRRRKEAKARAAKYATDTRRPSNSNENNRLIVETNMNSYMPTQLGSRRTSTQYGATVVNVDPSYYSQFYTQSWQQNALYSQYHTMQPHPTQTAQQQMNQQQTYGWGQ